MKKFNIVMFGIVLLFMVVLTSNVNATTIDLSDLTYIDSGSVSGSLYISKGLFVKEDGLTLWTIENRYDLVRQYNLSTPYDISTLSFTKQIDLTGTISNPLSMYINENNLFVYSGFFSGQVRGVHKYDINNYDVTTYNNEVNLSLPYSNGYSLTFYNNGNNFYFNDLDDFYAYEMTSPYDISTASQIQTKTISGSTAYKGSAFSVDGTQMLVVESSSNTVKIFNLSQAYNISTMNNIPDYSTNLNSSNTDSENIALIDNNLYVVDSADNLVYHYTLGGNTNEVINTFNVTNTQTPNNITTSTIGNLTINTTINDTLGELSNLNDSYTTINFNVEAQANNNCGYINLNNNVCYDLSFNSNMTKINNSEFYTLLDENKYLPAVYAFNQTWLETQTFTNYVLKSNSILRFKIKNMSTTQTDNIILEYNIPPVSTTLAEPLMIYYCNSSYTTGDFTTSNNCELIGEILSNEPFNHCHSISSCHYIARVDKGITWTETGSFIFDTNAVISPNGWNAKYTTNNSYTTSSFDTSTNKGNSWTSSNNIFDIHLHQFRNTDNINYNTTFYDGEGNSETSITTIDYFDFINSPPTPFIVNNPTNNFTVTINSTGVDVFFSWDNTTDPEDDDFTFTVALSEGGQTPTTNISGSLTTLNYTESFNTSTYDRGEYKAFVYATDENSDYVISTQTGTFNVCVNQWVTSLGVCYVYNETTGETRQLKTYNDIYNCDESYDVPSDNNTFVYDCTIPTSTTTSINQILVITGIIAILLLFLWTFTKNIVVGFINFFYMFGLTYYLNTVFESSIILFGMIMVCLIYTLIILLQSISKK